MSAVATDTADIRVENHGSLFLLVVSSERAEHWLVENTRGTWWWGGGGDPALVAEPRYVADIVAGARGAGLEVR